MFTLRTFNSDGIERNEFIGNDYSFINREVNAEEFRRCYKVVFGINHVADLDETSDNFSRNCYGLVSYNNGAKLIPLYKNQQNYIVSCNGQTFDNLTYK